MKNSDKDKSSIQLLSVAAALILAVGSIVCIVAFSSGREIYRSQFAEASPKQISEKTGEVVRQFNYRERAIEKWSRIIEQPGPNGSPIILFEERQNLEYFDAIFSRRNLVIPSAMTLPSERKIVLDTKGRLVEFVALPPRTYDGSEPAPAFDWNLAFSSAGLDLAKFTALDPAWTPEAPAETYAAWTGVLPDSPETGVRVEASSFKGRLTNFHIIYKWTPPERELPVPATMSDRLQLAAMITVAAAFAVFFVLVIYRNFSTSKVDLGASIRIASAALAFTFIGLCLTTPLTDAAAPLFQRAVLALGFSVCIGFATWLVFAAFQPLVREFDSDLALPLTSIFKGNWRVLDVGNSLLFGAASGLVMAAIYSFWSAQDTNSYRLPISILNAQNSPLGNAMVMVAYGILSGTLISGVYGLLGIVVRNAWIAAIANIAIFTTIGALLVDSSTIGIASCLLLSATATVASARFGMLATIIASIIFLLVGSSIVTFDLTVWYSMPFIIAATIVIVMVVVGSVSLVSGKRSSVLTN